MKVYFVRHGESLYNTENIVQPFGSKLSEQGKEQAKFLAKRFQSIPVDIIFSSPMERAKQTAYMINEVLKKTLIETELLQERKRPTELIGKHTEDPEVKRVTELIDQNISNPSWRHSDEENFLDLQARAQQLLGFLGERKEENILCVTHGIFLRFIIGVMGFGEQFTPQTFVTLQSFFKTNNTGITLCVREESVWKLITWNDHAHLG